MTDKATVEIFRAGKWQPAATIKPDAIDEGHNGHCRLEYCSDYAFEHIATTVAQAAGVSCRYPVDFALHDENNWPAFLLDIIPNGAGREHWLKRLDISDGASADWPLLVNGAAFPPGNLRIREAFEARTAGLFAPTATGEIVSIEKHPGFSINDIYERQEHFIEYAYQNGAQTGGASDVQGVAPKFLMVMDHADMWHAEGVLDDTDIASHWLIKFPRGTTVDDRKILCNEAAYMSVAAKLGLKVHADLSWNSDTLLIPRFDRVISHNGTVTRIGMESLCSLAGITKYGIEYGGTPSHNTLCVAIARYATYPEKELLEYIKRDIVNVVMGNKDNHPRNTAVYRYEDGSVELTPLFDFAPMYLDPTGIARVCRWEGDLEHGGIPIWNRVIDALPVATPQEHIRDKLHEFAKHLEQLPKIMETAGVDSDIIDFRARAIEEHAMQLHALNGS